MHILPPNKKIRDAIILVIAFILCAVIFISRYNSVTVPHPWILAACDSLFGVGLFYVFWGFLMYVSFKGGLDSLFYLGRNFVSLFRRERDGGTMTYYEYVASREHMPNRYKTFLLLGGIMLVLFVVFFFRYRKYCR